MRASVKRMAAAFAAAITASTLGATGASAASPAAQPPLTAGTLSAPAAPGPGTRLWVARYNGPGNGDDGAASVAVSPDGKRVFVTGASLGSSADDDYATVAYNAATGARLWVARYNGPDNSYGSAVSVAVSPDGAGVYVTGMTSSAGGTGAEWGTVAYNAVTGAQRWAEIYTGPAGDFNHPAQVMVSPDGQQVYVTGGVAEVRSGEGYYGTVAYDAVTGARLWARLYETRGLADEAGALAISPGGRRIYVTGQMWNHCGTIAYSSAAGARLWVRQYAEPGRWTSCSAAAASSDGKRVFVTGTATVAYTPSGTRLWRHDNNGSGRWNVYGVSLSAPGNGKLYVTGTTKGGDYATIAYSVFTGARLWARRYHGPASGTDIPAALAAGAGRVFVTGTSPGRGSGRDYVTIAYHG